MSEAEIKNLESKTKEEIVKTPIKELGLNMENCALTKAVEKLYQELEAVGLKFRPPVYLSDDWGCPDEVAAIGVPFYLAHKKLREIEQEKTGIVETDEEIMQILRHEAGHAFNYAHSLYQLPRWNKIFGVFDKPYEENFAPIVGSGKFVEHLEGWYAQKHPDEDFAETFAVLITLGADWEKKYYGTRAYKKIAYASVLIKTYGLKPWSIPIKEEFDKPIESLTMTLEEWYKERLASPPKGIKILILFYQEYPKHTPVRDEVVDQIKTALLQLNHRPVLLPVNQSIQRIVNGIKQENPDLIFNLCETFRNNDTFDFNVTALLEMTKVPFTGASSGALFISQDKYLSKKIFDFHKINYPDFGIVPRKTEPIMPKGFSFPMLIKPVHQDASVGIDIDSVVYTEEALLKKVKELQGRIDDDVLIEEYIDGREFFVSILGNEVIKPLPIIELDFSKWPNDKPKIYTNKAKVDERSKEFKATPLKIPDDLEEELKNRIYDTAVSAYRVLGGRDYGRVDIRMSADKKFYILEANFNPYLAANAETAFAAQAVGLNFNQLIDKIIEAALTRIGKIYPLPAAKT